MANRIKMALAEAILRLLGLGWTQRRVARELDVNRETVARYVRLAADTAGKPAKVPAGAEGAGEAKPATLPAGSYSTCRPHHAAILAGVEAGLNAQRIFQDLRTDEGFEGGYDAVKRYVRRLAAKSPHAVTRMECAPGEEAQVDFGLGAPIRVEGRKRRSWVFRIVLSHSRKGFSEAVFQQTTEAFIRCLESAFRHFGGVPRTLVIDNLRAAVKRADWYEPELTPKMAEFCRHHGTVILPTRPRRPEHKGKVERAVAFVKGNGLKGRVFTTLAEENAYLLWWETHVADQRIHGTTRQHVGRRFEQERPTLQALTPLPFPCFDEGPRTVHRDAHVEVKHAYYPVPEEYIGRQVWVRYDGRLVRVFNHRMDLLATYTRQPPGTFAPAAPGVATRRTAQTAEELCQRAEQVGPACGEWAQRVRIERGVEAIRVLLGFLKLSKRVGKPMLEAACTQASANGAWHLRDLRRYLEGRPPAQQLNFMEQHPLIRDLGEYGAWIDGTQREAEKH